MCGHDVTVTHNAAVTRRNASVTPDCYRALRKGLRSATNSVILTDASLIPARNSVSAERGMVRVQNRRPEVSPPRTRRKAGFVYLPVNSVTMTDGLQLSEQVAILAPWPDSHWTRGLDLPFPRRCVPERSGTILGVGYDAAQSKSPRCRACNGAVRSPRTSVPRLHSTTIRFPLDWTRSDETCKQAARVLAFGATLAFPALLTGMAVHVRNCTPKKEH